MSLSFGSSDLRNEVVGCINSKTSYLGQRMILLLYKHNNINHRSPCLCARYILHLTYSVCRRNVLLNRVWLTPFSAPLESKPDLLKSTATNRGAGKNVRTTSHYETQSQCGYGAYSDCQERDHPNPAAAEGLP